jgi:transposase-like protein
MAKRRTYNRELKLEAARLVVERRVTVTRAGRMNGRRNHGTIHEPR